jgi:zinc protease
MVRVGLGKVQISLPHLGVEILRALFDAVGEEGGGCRLGGFLADAVTLGLPLDESERYGERIRATTSMTMRAAARRLDPEQAYVVVVGDAGMFIDTMRAAHPDLVVIPAAELDLLDPTLGL